MREIALNIYSSIHNTLQVLESGHVLGCYKYISTLSNCNFIFKDYSDYNTITFTNILKLTNAYDKFNIIMDKFKNRSSGRYYGMISNWNEQSNIHNFIGISKPDILEISRVTDNKMDSVIPISYVNNGHSMNHLSNEFIQKEYPFFNPTYGSAITVLSLNLKVCNLQNIEIYLEKIGALAQIICIKNSYSDVINRPVKQVIPKNWRKINEFKCNQYLLPFYAVITSKI